MNAGMIRWNLLSLYPIPFSPVHKARKFSTVLGTTSPYKSKVIRPAFSEPICTSKYTEGFFIARDDLCGMFHRGNLQETMRFCNKSIFSSFAYLEMVLDAIPPNFDIGRNAMVAVIDNITISNRLNIIFDEKVPSRMRNDLTLFLDLIFRYLFIIGYGGWRANSLVALLHATFHFQNSIYLILSSTSSLS